jgi:uncharacterized tellurite resistance protein B-like protein
MDLNDMIPGVRTIKNTAIGITGATLGFLAGRTGKSNMKKEISKLEKELEDIITGNSVITDNRVRQTVAKCKVMKDVAWADGEYHPDEAVVINEYVLNNDVLSADLKVKILQDVVVQPSFFDRAKDLITANIDMFNNPEEKAGFQSFLQRVAEADEKITKAEKKLID